MLDKLVHYYTNALSIYEGLAVLTGRRSWYVSSKAEAAEAVEVAYERGMIHIDDLIPGAVYLGYSRGVTLATWSGENFQYPKNEMGFWNLDEIPHPAKDRGWEVFVPTFNMSIHTTNHLIDSIHGVEND